LKRLGFVRGPMRRPSLLLTLLLVVAALAGCAERPTDTPPVTSTPVAQAGKCTSTLDATKSAVSPTVVMETSMGTIRLALFCDKAPVTASHIAKLVEAGCYDGTKFHRVVRGFMDQGGDPLSKDDAKAGEWGTGGPSDCGQSPDTIVEEFYCADGTVTTATPAGNAPATQCDAHGGLGLKHEGPGVWSMARTSAPATSGSQFFLTAATASFLDGRYTVFGHTADEASTKVVVDINNVTCGGQPCRDPPQGSSRPDTPVVVTRATVVW
jgi:peptidylprolyl isomerase